MHSLLISAAGSFIGTAPSFVSLAFVYRLGRKHERHSNGES